MTGFNHFLALLAMGSVFPASWEARANVSDLRIATFQAHSKSIKLRSWEGNKDEMLSALHALGTKFSTYSLGEPGSQVDLKSIALSMVNEVDSSYTMDGGVLSKSDLGSQEKASIVKSIRREITPFLSRRSQMSDTARYRFIVHTYGAGSFFDSNQNANFGFRVHLFLVDTTSKKLVWFSDQAFGVGRDVTKATSRAAGSVKFKLVELLGK